jgi:hypothetical protein
VSGVYQTQSRCGTRELLVLARISHRFQRHLECNAVDYARTWKAFLDLLHAHCIKRVVDVRTVVNRLDCEVIPFIHLAPAQQTAPQT